MYILPVLGYKYGLPKLGQEVLASETEFVEVWSGTLSQFSLRYCHCTSVTRSYEVNPQSATDTKFHVKFIRLRFR